MSLRPTLKVTVCLHFSEMLIIMAPEVGLTEPPINVTELLHRSAAGDKVAESALITAVYAELRQIARRLMRGEAANHTLQTTALVHEAYLRLAQTEHLDFNDRNHFFAVAATVMRRILVDHARAKTAEKRGGPQPNADYFLGPTVNLQAPEEIIAIDAALTRLSAIDDRQVRIVELRYFAGMTVEETAEELNISSRTVKREWQLARAWLFGELGK